MNPTTLRRPARSTRLVLVACLLLPGCAPLIRKAEPPPDWPLRLSEAEVGARASNFPLPPAELERSMRDPRLEIREGEPAGAGVTGAFRIEAELPSGRSLSFKWKAAPEGGDGWNNSPRREIAAYRIQKWFLGPEDYVVPTTIPRCIPLSAYTRLQPEPVPNLPEARCIFGTLTVWLEGVEPPAVQLDEARFYRNARYAHSIASYNLLTYLVCNRDTRVGNILVSSDREVARVYSVDNGISFGTGIYNFLQRHWDEIRVPGLPREAIDRLRAIDEEDLQALRVVAELHRDDAGIYRETTPSRPFDAARGVRLRDRTLQLGLEPEEIDGLRQRLAALIRAVDRGEIPVF